MSKRDYCNIPVVYSVFRMSVPEYRLMRRWLMDNVHAECYDAEDFTFLDADYTKRRIWFAKPADATMFALRWS